MDVRFPSPSFIVNKPILRIGLLQPLAALLLCTFDTRLGIAFATVLALITVPYSIHVATRARFTLTDMQVNLWLTRVSLFGSLGLTFSGVPILILLANGDGVPIPEARHTAFLGSVAFLISLVLVVSYAFARLLPREEPALALIAAEMVAPKDRGWEEPELDIVGASPKDSRRYMWVAYLVMGMLPVAAAWLNRDVQDVRMGVTLVLAPVIVVMLLSMVPKEVRTHRVLSLLRQHELSAGHTFHYAHLDQIHESRAQTWLGRRFGANATVQSKRRRSSGLVDGGVAGDSEVQ